jgi:glyoxylase-like metal-dependent hydrolase (beta-lactamase superfamily II)
MREVLDGIVMWSWPSPPHGYDFNGYFIRHPEGNVVVDPVEPADGVLELLAREGVARVVLTNRNHARRASLVRERTGARVAIHPADAEHARTQGAEIDDVLAVGGRVGPFTVVGVPGKSPGEVALHWPERRLLVVGDAVIGNPPGALSLLRERVMDDPALLRASVRALAALDLETLLVGDGVPLLTGAGARLRELVATFPSG